MKKMLFTLVTMLTIAASANAMSYEQARNEALFLTDKMAYELNLSDAQYEAAYEINLDYLMGVTSYNDVYGVYWERRNLDLSYILYQWQWDAFRAASYFYRPLYWEAGIWHFGIYARYPHRDYFYFGRPHFFASYRGGHSWRNNGGRSFYEGRHHQFRPDRPRDQHFGMRNGWDRGDYRGHNDRPPHRDNNRDFRQDNNRDFRNENFNRGGGNQRNGDFNRNSGDSPRGNDSGSRSINPGNRGNQHNDNGSFRNNGGSPRGNDSGSRSMNPGNRGGGDRQTRSAQPGGSNGSRGQLGAGRNGGGRR